MNNLLEIRFHGRGGQGSVTAAELVATAAFYDGKFSQAFPSFGVERRGAPVMAYCRIAAQPIRRREQIYWPDFVVIQDSTLIKVDPQVLSGIGKQTGILINSETVDWPQIKKGRVIAIPATKIALEKIGKPFINTAIIGALAAMSGAISLAALKRAVAERFPAKVAEANIAAMETAFDFVKKNI